MSPTFISRVLNSVRTNASVFQHARPFSSHLQQAHPEIAAIYSKLLDQPNRSPMACNFVRQVLDHWGSLDNRIAFRSIDSIEQEQVEISYAELVERSYQIADFFIHQGFKKGDKVALMLDQRTTWWYALAGLMRAGIAVVPCPPLLSSNELIYRINDLGIRGLLTFPRREEDVDRAIREHCPSLQTTLTTGRASKRWFSIVDAYSCSPATVTPSTTTEDPCLYLYTSGTTDQPKAVQHNADYPFLHGPKHQHWLRASPDELIYNASSNINWEFSIWITALAWSRGSQLLITPNDKKFEARSMLTTLREQSVSLFCTEPKILQLLVADPAFKSIQLPALKRIVTTSGRLDKTAIAQLAANGIEVAAGFGEAKTSLLIGQLENKPYVTNITGGPVLQHKVVVEDENHMPLFPDRAAQIKRKRIGFIGTYAKPPMAIIQIRSSDGRFRIYGGSAFFSSNRHRNLIENNAIRFCREAVEKAAKSHPAVAQIAAISIRTDRNSPEITVKAFILLKSDYHETPQIIEWIQAHIEAKTSQYNYPCRVECVSMEEWKKYEVNGEICRAALREREEQRLLNDENEMGVKGPLGM